MNIKQPYQEKLTTVEEKKDFLIDHFDYHTANSWNGGSCFAHCIKVNKLGLSRDDVDQVWNFLDEEIDDNIRWEDFRDTMEAFCHKGYKIEFNGRSGGYLVLKLDKYPCYSTKNIDDITEWYENEEFDEIEYLYDVVYDFGKTVHEACSNFLNYCLTHKVVEEEVEVVTVKKVKTVVEK